MPYVVVDQKTYSVLREKAAELGISISGLIRLLATTAFYEGDEVVVLVNTSYSREGIRKRIKVLSSEAYHRMLREYNEVLGRIKELEEENRRLRRLLSRDYLYRKLEEMKKTYQRLRKRIAWIEKTRAYLLSIKDMEREVEERIKHLETIETMDQMRNCKVFARELAKHGLLGDARKWLRGEANELSEYVETDDVYYMIMQCIEEIMESGEKDSDVKKSFKWIT